MQAKKDIKIKNSSVSGNTPEQTSFDAMIEQIRLVFSEFPDPRRGKNKTYSMLDAALGAFAVFFTQSPSFLAHQSHMKKTRGQSNADTIFRMSDIPTDAQIRSLLDHTPPETVYPAFDAIYDQMVSRDMLEPYKSLNGGLLIALDGVHTHSSEKIHCKNCSVREHKDGRKDYGHSAVMPALMTPLNSKAIPLRPEFVVPQDGHEKQDCEIAAAKRWLLKHADYYKVADTPTTYLGDDLYAHEPFCRKVIEREEYFIFTCKTASHKALYEWLEPLEEDLDIGSVTKRKRNAKGHWETHKVRYASDLPLTDSSEALRVGWLELVVKNSEEKEIYRNSWITNWGITDENALAIAEAGRSRWNIENGNNNTLKTKGYHLEHNFGHGKKHLSNLLVALNILAFLLHTLLDETDRNYKMVRDALPSRKTFFEHLRALTTYICFPTWDAMIDFMMQGLEIGPYEPRPGKTAKTPRRKAPR